MAKNVATDMQEGEEGELSDMLAEAAADQAECRSGNCGLDLVTIVGLTQWVEESVALIGKEKLEALLEVCQMSGHLPPEFREIIVRLTRSYSSPEPREGQATARDYLAILVQLENLLGHSTQRETALLSILSDSNAERDEIWIRR